ncbi:MAG TPA: polyprenyl synthetase family protein [Kofleriaceae bacterium]|nr:polyprenyl synthetase family protein [Kofleriaceae bacterium]
MKPGSLASPRSPALDALAEALAAGGASALDPTVPAAVWRRALAGPAADFLARPGKQLRATLVQAGWSLAGAAGPPPERLPLVLELLHAGSLVIDDVEDGSRERRGAPALHERVGVPLAINTGSWMYFWALAELGRLGRPAAVELRAQRAASSTLVRCHLGQALDLGACIDDLELADVPAVVAATTRLKTATLCRFAVELGALAAGASDERVAAAGDFGEAAGTGLQMLDDLGSLTCAARHDKGREDLRGRRPTWPWAWLAGHRPFAWARLSAMARAAAATADAAELEPLRAALAGEIEPIGRDAIRAVLAGAITDLERSLGATPAVAWIGDQLARMEHSYG